VDDESELLSAVRKAWAETLGTDEAEVPLDVGFFDAGGNSLLLLLLWEQLAELTSQDLRATDLFQHPTVRSQVEILGGGT
jgi:hypothetical protein